ncbi:hypothetical protein O998_03340 [Anaplasma phagocytophilum str. Norway variant1]|uniref:Uncharacterized protein n=1 Tax=Anaplasma phagocytophilum str. Norway variant1 TaxID=1392506 RepID=A0A7H9DZ39_ANAPH|nr:hypothetical protein [Anaplasma phagocytophilum]QLL66818.1 hypothetical protein O998_03340 [Anaplasma phagocytophilum str. Norway variant1]
MVNAMHGHCIVTNYGSGYQPVCSRLIAELQSGRCSYFSFLKSLLSVLEHAVEATERAQSIVGQIGRVGCGIDAQRLATAQVRLSRVSESVGAVIQNAAASEDKAEEISRNFLEQTCNELIEQCFVALYYISDSRSELRILKEYHTDAFSSVSNTVLGVVDAITLMRRAHTYVTTGSTAESSAIIGARRRIVRYMSAACYAVHAALPGSTIQPSVDASGGGCSAPEIREMVCYQLQESALLSNLIHSGEETVNLDCVLYAYFTLKEALRSLLCGFAPSWRTDAESFALIFNAIDQASAERMDMEKARVPSDCAEIDQRDLHSILLEALAMAHMVNASCAARVQKAKKPDPCARSILETSEKIQKALSTIQESERRCVDLSLLRYANVCYAIRSSLDDAQLLLESIDASSLPNPQLHGELLNRIRRFLLDAGSLCIRLQCATDPEYRPPQAVMQQRHLSSMLLEAVSIVYIVQTSFNAIPPIAGDIGKCQRTVFGIGGKLQKALAVMRGIRLSEIKSLEDANVCSDVLGLVADAQLLLESIDASSLPNPQLHGELLSGMREILIGSGSLCIGLQCATEPEYRPTQAVIHQRNVTDVLLETMYALHVAHISSKSPVIEKIKEKLQEALAVMRGIRLSEIKSLEDANVCSDVLGLVADAQLLLESINVYSSQNPSVNRVLLNNVRYKLCEAASICIGLQCAGNPEYMTPQESDFDPGVGEGNPSTYLAALSTLMSAFSLHSRRQ